jgi:CubicO group peptidase (beta-lactamase class C family)
MRLPTGYLLLLLVATMVLPAAAAQPAPLDGLDAYIEAGMAEWQIPGLAIAVVKDDEVVFARGYGVRELGRPERVDEHTLFGVASTTKAMTAAALAMLVDEDRLTWDTRVVDVMPEFRLSDPWVTQQVTVRDLLAHRVGVGRITGNRIQFMTHRPRAEIIYRMRYHDFEQPFRQGFVYSNVMYSVAGELIPAVTGQGWDAFLAERIFRPLGMTRSNTSITQIASGENAAWPHQEIDGVVATIPRRNFDNVGPSASVNTSAVEMAQWMRMQLGEPGVFEGRRLVSETQMREMRQAQNALPIADLFTGSLSAYGFGWQLRQHRGHAIAAHSGATDGMNTNLILVPGENLGVVVMTNTFNSFMVALANEVVDRYIGEAGTTDWAALVRAGYAPTYQAAQARRAAIEAARVPGTSPTLPLARYAGFYADSLYDRVEVRLEDGRLALHFWDDETLVADLEHWHHDTFRAVWRNPAQREKFVWFDLDPDGAPGTLNVEFTLRPVLLQVGIYPSHYTRVVPFRRPGRPAGMAGGPR